MKKKAFKKLNLILKLTKANGCWDWWGYTDANYGI